MPETAQQPKNIPLPQPIKHPVRFSIRELKDKIPDLKVVIKGSELHEGLKSFINDELDKMTSNAAEIHLHDVERSDGGFDLHVSVKPVFLGARSSSIFKKPAEPKPPALASES